jgi:hypothetical protein
MKADITFFWNTKREKLLKKYNNLDKKDLKFNLGEENKMLETLSQKLGKPLKELLSIIITL